MDVMMFVVMILAMVVAFTFMKAMLKYKLETTLTHYFH